MSLTGSGWIALAAFLIGSFWAVALLHLPRWRLQLFGLAVTGLAGVFAFLGQWQMQNLQSWGWGSTLNVAVGQIGPPIYPLCLGLALIPLSLGLRFGRPFVRGLIRGLLPPRLRAPFAGLWTVDGLAPPRRGAPLGAG